MIKMWSMICWQISDKKKTVPANTDCSSIHQLEYGFCCKGCGKWKIILGAGATALRLRSTSWLGLTSPEVPRGLHHQPPSVTKGRRAPVKSPPFLWVQNFWRPTNPGPKCDGEPDPGPGKNPDVEDPPRLCLCLPVYDVSETVDSPWESQSKADTSKIVFGTRGKSSPFCPVWIDKNAINWLDLVL